MSGRAKSAARRVALAGFGDEALLRELARRLNHGDVTGDDLEKALTSRLRPRIAGRLVEQLATYRPIDYDPHVVELVLGSSAVTKRLESVQKEPFTVEWIESSIKPGDVFYDVGANVGAYALIAAKATGNAARVFAFEPSPGSFYDLTRNVVHNDCGASVVALPLALWSETRLLTFELRSDRAGEARHHIARDEVRPRRLLQSVLGIRLDDLVESCGLPVPTHAKVDVDGYELDVLRGAEKTLARPEWQSVIVELDREQTERNDAIKALLEGAGLTEGRSHVRAPSPRYPRPDERPDVYWTFTRGAA